LRISTVEPGLAVALTEEFGLLPGIVDGAQADRPTTKTTIGTTRSMDRQPMDAD
jgi:hypothetical protein